MSNVNRDPVLRTYQEKWWRWVGGLKKVSKEDYLNDKFKYQPPYPDEARKINNIDLMQHTMINDQIRNKQSMQEKEQLKRIQQRRKDNGIWP